MGVGRAQGGMRRPDEMFVRGTGRAWQRSWSHTQAEQGIARRMTRREPGTRKPGDRKMTRTRPPGPVDLALPIRVVRRRGVGRTGPVTALALCYAGPIKASWQWPFLTMAPPLFANVQRWAGRQDGIQHIGHGRILVSLYRDIAGETLFAVRPAVARTSGVAR